MEILKNSLLFKINLIIFGIANFANAVSLGQIVKSTEKVSATCRAGFISDSGLLKNHKKIRVVGDFFNKRASISLSLIFFDLNADFLASIENQNLKCELYQKRVLRDGSFLIFKIESPNQWSLETEMISIDEELRYEEEKRVSYGNVNKARLYQPNGQLEPDAGVLTPSRIYAFEGKIHVEPLLPY